MNSNTLSTPTVFTTVLKQNKRSNFSAVNYWKVTLTILIALIIGGFILNMISGLASIILIGSIATAIALKPIMEILNMDFDLSHLELNDIHEELWN